VPGEAVYAAVFDGLERSAGNFTAKDAKIATRAHRATGAAALTRQIDTAAGYASRHSIFRLPQEAPS
jgi:hypothetical protein